MAVAARTSSTAVALLEREDSLAALSEALGDTRLGRGRLVFVTGEAGAGKTALVRAFSETLPGGTRLLAGACDALSTPRPLGPLLDVAGSEGALSDLVRFGAPASNVYEAVREQLEARPTVLVLEDIHWADDATLDVLRLLARRIEGIPALVVVTYRDDGLHRAHPVRTLVGDLATVTAVDRLALRPLSRTAVAELALGHPVDADGLYVRTDGNPFLVAQVLAVGAAEVPETVRDAVLARAAGLGPDATAVLEAIALAPPRVEPWLLTAVAGKAAEQLEDCLATGLITADGRGVAFRHELARLAVAEQTPPTRGLGLQRAILAALSDPPAGVPDLARLAHHAEAAQDAGAVLEFAPAAARRAAQVGAFREAAAQYARALRFAADLAPGERAKLLEGRSRALHVADDQVQAIAVIRAAIECRKQQPAPLQQAVALSELSTYLSCLGLLSEANDAVAEATRLVAGRPETRELASVQWAGARMLLLRGDADGGLELARAAFDVAERCGDDETAGEVLVTLGTIELSRDFDAGQEILERAAAEGRNCGRPLQVARALNNLGAFGVTRRRHEIANTYIPAALEYCAEQNLDLWRINVLALSARSALDQGRWTEAADSALRLLQDPRDSPWPRHEALLVLALVRARRGDPDARAAVDRARAAGVPAEEVFAIVDLAATQAEIAWLEHRPEGVDEATGAVLAAALARGDSEAICRLSHWRRLASLDGKAPADATGPYALALALDWERAAAAWTTLGCPYEAALALAQTTDEESLRRALDELRRLGALPLAQFVTRRLRALGARAVVRGPRRPTRENPAGLTQRESEVLGLVAEGCGNAEIAERLFLSPRTVAHHVSAILRKLDASSRGAAVAAARRRSLF